MNEHLSKLLNLAEEHKGKHVEIIFKTGDSEIGILERTIFNNISIAVELADESGKSVLFDLSKIAIIQSK